MEDDVENGIQNNQALFCQLANFSIDSCNTSIQLSKDGNLSDSLLTALHFQCFFNIRVQ
jgi:hypothetical protein